MAFAAGQHLGALGFGVGNVLFDLGHGLLIDQRTLRHAGIDARADLQFVDLGYQLGGEDLKHTFLHIDSVGADAGLSGVAVLRYHGAFDRGVQISVVKHDKRRVTAEL